MEVSPYSFFDVSLTSAYFLKHPVLISLTREYKIVSRGCLVQTKYIQYSKYVRDISSLLLYIVNRVETILKFEFMF